MQQETTVGAVGQVPDSVLGLFLASGVYGLLITLLALVLLAGFVVGVVTRSRRIVLVYLGLSFCPLLIGLAGTFTGMMRLFGSLAQDPSATAQDLFGGIYFSMTPQLMGTTLTVPAVASAFLLLAFSKREVPSDSL